MPPPPSSVPPSPPAALVAVLPSLRCPVCADGLAAVGGGLTCPAGHRFDLARQGYVSLLAGRRGAASGDDAAMVGARQDVLAAGHYAPLTRAVVGAAAVREGLVVDVGSGTGQHLAAVVDASPGVHGLALDASAAALRRAARVHPRVAAVGADVWAGLPVADGAAAVVLDVFSPRNAAEFARVLAPGGRLVVAVPRPGHLAELVAAAGLIAVDADKDRRLGEQLADRFRRSASRDVGWMMRLDRRAAATLVAMTPSARHVGDDAVRERLAGLAEPVLVTASVRVETFHVRPAG